MLRTRRKFVSKNQKDLYRLQNILTLLIGKTTEKSIKYELKVDTTR
jgi:hypothetical protein